VAEEIKLGRPSLGGGGVLNPAWEGGAPGVGFLCGGAGGEGGHEDAERLLTGDEERRMAGDGAVARCLDCGSARRRGRAPWNRGRLE
jgi:hypothetical protein